MKEVTTIRLTKDKKLDLRFNIRLLNQLEREIGQSLISIINVPNTMLRKIDIDFTVAALRNGVSNGNLTREQALDNIQEFCDNGGTLDELNGLIIKAIIDTGLFTPGVAEPVAETPAKVEVLPKEVLLEKEKK